MKDDDPETLVSQFLHGYALRCERPSKEERRRGKTPDFRVYLGGDFCFFCEVKSVRGDDWLGRQLADAAPMQIVSGARPDPTFNRLTDDIHTAVQQFDAVNADRHHPNVLAFVNYEQICDLGDLLAVVTGNFYASDGTRHPIYRQYSRGRIRTDNLRIDLYLWLKGIEDHHLRFTLVHQEHHLTLCRRFGLDPASIKSVDA